MSVRRWESTSLWYKDNLLVPGFVKKGVQMFMSVRDGHIGKTGFLEKKTKEHQKIYETENGNAQEDIPRVSRG
jgi:hypothetical protein